MTIKRENYITIQGWMVTDLNLKGNSLLIYAIIYGFSQEDGQWFTGSRQYLADWTNSTKQGVTNGLKALLDGGLLEKQEEIRNGVKFCSYRATKFIGGRQQSLPGVDNKVYQGQATKLPGGRQQSCPNNIDDNSIYNLDINNMSDKPTTRPRFVKPTLDEIRAYCKERRNAVDPERFLAYYESNGWKVGKNPMKDWKAAVRNWERNSYAPKPQRDTGANWDDLDGIL